MWNPLLTDSAVTATLISPADDMTDSTSKLLPYPLHVVPVVYHTQEVTRNASIVPIRYMRLTMKSSGQRLCLSLCDYSIRSNTRRRFFICSSIWQSAMTSICMTPWFLYWTGIFMGLHRYGGDASLKRWGCLCGIIIFSFLILIFVYDFPIISWIFNLYKGRTARSFGGLRMTIIGGRSQSSPWLFMLRPPRNLVFVQLTFMRNIPLPFPRAFAVKPPKVGKSPKS